VTESKDTQEALEAAVSHGVNSCALLDEKLKPLYLHYYAELQRDHLGGLDRKTKELIALACALTAGAKNPAEGHLKKAVECGATSQELSEAVGIAAGIGAAAVIDLSDIAAHAVKFNSSMKPDSQGASKSLDSSGSKNNV